MEQPLAGRVALVTGVSRRKGIGFAIADRLAALGADVFVQSWRAFDAANAWGADPAGIAPLLDELRTHGTRIAHQEADFTDPDAPRRLVDAAVAAFGHLEILVANHAYDKAGTLEELTAQDIDTHLIVNTRASLLLVQAFAAQYQAQNGGRIILLISGQHITPMPGELAYAASKGALHQITPSLSAHLIGRGITVNAIDPGPTDTGWAAPDLYEQIRAVAPLGRWGQPEDVARLVGWLATDDSGWITGQIINSRGGF
jgi:3-oxoacyl-[acyl-carrier protein] reductase